VYARKERWWAGDRGALGRRPGRGPGGLAGRVLELQQTAGNAAVARLVQRWLARRPKPAHAAAAAPAAKSRPLTIAEEHWDRPTLIGHAGDAFNGGDFAHAAALYERAYELSPSRDIALNIYRCYQKLGDSKQAEHWLSVHHGTDQPTPPVEYQQF
jgi:hypothetical protein